MTIGRHPRHVYSTIPFGNCIYKISQQNLDVLELYRVISSIISYPNFYTFEYNRSSSESISFTIDSMLYLDSPHKGRFPLRTTSVVLLQGYSQNNI